MMRQSRSRPIDRLYAMSITATDAPTSRLMSEPEEISPP